MTHLLLFITLFYLALPGFSGMIVKNSAIIFRADGEKAQVSRPGSKASRMWLFLFSYSVSTAANLEQSPFPESPGEKPNVDSPARHGDAAAKMPRGLCRRTGRAGALWARDTAPWGSFKEPGLLS